jgi:hypothetical protein
VFVPFSTATVVAAGLTAGAVLSLGWELVRLVLCVLLVLLVLTVFAAPCPPADARPVDFPPPPEERTSTIATTTTITPPRISIVARAGDLPARDDWAVFASGRRARDSALRRSACLVAAAVRAVVPSGVLRRGSVGAGGREEEALRLGGTAVERGGEAGGVDEVGGVEEAGDVEEAGSAPALAAAGDGDAAGGVGARGVAVAGPAARAAAAAVAGAPEAGIAAAPSSFEPEGPCGVSGDGADGACPAGA